MTYGEDGKFNAAYTYGLERVSVEAVDETRPESQDPLYYLYDELGSVAYIIKPDGNIRDHYRYDAFGKPAPRQHEAIVRWRQCVAQYIWLHGRNVG